MDGWWLCFTRGLSQGRGSLVGPRLCCAMGARHSLPLSVAAGRPWALWRVAGPRSSWSSSGNLACDRLSWPARSCAEGPALQYALKVWPTNKQTNKMKPQWSALLWLLFSDHVFMLGLLCLCGLSVSEDSSALDRKHLSDTKKSCFTPSS